MASDDDKSPDDTPWFRRFRPDGRMEPLVARGEKGEIVVIDDGGWAASFKDARWHDGLLFSHERMAEFSPVQQQAEVYRVFGEARAALGMTGE
jgi:hypothetical protein